MMKSPPKMRRRDFLQGTSSSLGLLAVAGTLGTAGTLRAAAGKPWLPKDLAAVEELIAQMEPDGPPYLALPRADGRFFNLLVRAARARHILEIGTAHGYATIWMAAGLKETDGHLTTLEILEDRADAARRHVSRAGLSDRVTFEVGDAHKLVPGLGGRFDLVLLAADKAGLVDYFNSLSPKKLAPGAVLVAIGAIKQREKMKPYLDLMASHPDFDTVTVSATLEDGFALSIQKRII
jgi:predicted O-methyltransferase YrrM